MTIRPKSLRSNNDFGDNDLTANQTYYRRRPTANWKFISHQYIEILKLITNILERYQNDCEYNTHYDLWSSHLLRYQMEYNFDNDCTHSSQICSPSNEKPFSEHKKFK